LAANLFEDNGAGIAPSISTVCLIHFSPNDIGGEPVGLSGYGIQDHGGDIYAESELVVLPGLLFISRRNNRGKCGSQPEFQ
jgi:hypothetical protein